MAILKTTSTFFIRNLEQIFFRWGCFVSRYPQIVILGCILITALSCFGLFNLRIESRAEKLWIPADSPYKSNKQWLDANFPRHERYQSALFVSKEGPDGVRANILTPENLMQMLHLHQRVLQIQAYNRTWSDLCYRVPIADIFLAKKKRKRRQTLNINTSVSVLNKSPAVSDSGRDPKLIENDLKDDNFDTYSPFDDYYYYDNDQLDQVVIHDPVSESAVQDNVDIISDLPPDIYCDLVETLNDKCLESSILEIWKFNEDVIAKLSTQDILAAVNAINKSPHYGYNFNYSTLLGDIQRDEKTGLIIGAKSVQHAWITQINPDLKSGAGYGLELDLADDTSLLWEKKLIETMKEYDSSLTNLSVKISVHRSFNDLSTSAIFFDGVKMVSGYLLMFLYTVLMLGNVNRIEHRTYLTAAGITAVILGLVVSIGLGALMNLPYTPMHAILPFLCLGIGIDDMFVIMQCLYNLQSTQNNEVLDLHEQIGETLKHAGVAITVTSITDIFAFGIGAVTILPGLESFCAYCAIGIGAIYLFQCSWFVAWLSLDQRRIEARRDGLIPCCLVHKDWNPSTHRNQDNWTRNAFTYFANLVKNKIFKIWVLITTLALVSVGTWGTLLIRQHFDPVLLLPANTYLRSYLAVHQDHFPQDGWVADIYTGRLDPLTDLTKIDQLVLELESMAERKHYLKGVDAWWTNFKGYIAEEKNVSDWRSTIENNTEDAEDEQRNFPWLLSEFLHSRQGSKYKRNFHFDGNLTCNFPAPPITASQFSITYLPFSGPEEHIPGRRTVTKLIENANISSHTFSFSKVYAAWETDEIIGFELWRNLGLALVCVFVITLILLANIQICLMVLLCVTLTLVDMVGILHFWGITVDTLSCINIVLAIGLCVDYSAHIAHAFIVSKGTKEERAVNSLKSMGPAIINGGITTFLALVLLGFSQSHVFITFFKVFLLTVLFGLFHGVVFLPVLLSLLGPSHDEDEAPECQLDPKTENSCELEHSQATQVTVEMEMPDCNPDLQMKKTPN